MVHRDLKPSNLRLTRDGRLKILDFGLASLLQPVTNEPTATRTGGAEFAGTLPYMAPEQIRGEAVDERTDVYAAGAVLYEMATGRPLFPGARSGELVAAILSQAPPKPKLVNPRLSESLEHTILRALAKDRAGRLPSAADLRGALDPAVGATRPRTGVDSLERLLSWPSWPVWLAPPGSFSDSVRTRFRPPERSRWPSFPFMQFLYRPPFGF
jgi:serine/threonine protein kinase